MPSWELPPSRIRSTALAAVIIFGLLSPGIAPVHAADRPGTPTNVTATAQDPTSSRLPSVRVSWTNTATEDVCFEFYSTQNGSPSDLGAGCVGHGLASSDYVFEGLQPTTTYCFQVRARDWNGGDPQDGLVSNDWSALACATTAAAYVAPPSVASSTAESTALGLLGSAGPSVGSTTVGSLTPAGHTPKPTPIPRPH
jgi:hypothetical protein